MSILKIWNGTAWDTVAGAIPNFTTTQRVLGRNTAGGGAGEEVTLSQLLDWIGSATKGDILVRDTAAWARLAASTSGFSLRATGAGALPAYSQDGWVKLATATASASATIDFTGLTSTYAAYKIVFNRVIPVTDAAILGLRTSTDGGSTFGSGASSYSSQQWHWFVGGTAQDNNFDTYMRVTGQLDAENTNFGCNGEMLLIGLGAATYKAELNWQCQALNGIGTRYSILGCGIREVDEAINAIRFFMSTGNISTGIFTLYGLAA